MNGGAMEPKDIELGDELIEVERRPRSGVVISVRLSPDEADQLQAKAQARRTTLSSVAREAITSYLSHPSVTTPSQLTGGISGQDGMSGLFLVSPILAFSVSIGSRI